MEKDIKIFKQEKTDLIHVAICTLFVPSGYYEFKGEEMKKDGLISSF